jgi:hypothetical protein
MRFRVDVEAFRRVGAQLLGATDVLRDIETDRDSLKSDVSDSGHDGVRRAACRLIDAWAFAAGYLADDAETLSTLLVNAEAAYVEIDDAILRAWLEA